MTHTLWGPFTQLLPLSDLPTAGPLRDEQLAVIENAGIVVDTRGMIVSLGPYNSLSADRKELIASPSVALPGFIDCHTHICYAGTRAGDYAKRLAGASYQEIAAAGGGILDTVRQTRAASEEELVDGIVSRCQRLLEQGITTCEVKSGYGLSIESELKMLRAIKRADKSQPVSLVPTCLAAHSCPPEFKSPESGGPEAYLQHLIDELFPQLEGLTQRIDIFVEKGAFSASQARHYLQAAKARGFQLTVHADQFSRSGSQVAAELGALSADHLEVSEPADFEALRHSSVVPVVLPGASLGLGLPHAPARAMLDAGLPVAIASDWNPGSAPMGQLLTQAALLGAAQKLTHAETLTGITTRAAKALGLQERGQLRPGFRADLTIFPCKDYREILYQQGSLRPTRTLTQPKQEARHDYARP